MRGELKLGGSMFDVGMAVGFGVQAAKKHIPYIHGGLQVHLFLEHEFILLRSDGIESVALNLEGICEKDGSQTSACSFTGFRRLCNGRVSADL